MVYLIAAIIVLAALVLPGWWVKRTLSRYSVEYDALPGTGGELAKHLIERYELPVKLETTDAGDHYDPRDKTVRLSEQHMNGRSLSAVAVATHEVGHAIQHHQGYKLINLRTKLAGLAMSAERVGSLAFVILPILALVSRSPVVGASILMVAVGSMLIGVLVHLVTLPVEFDASFNRALPILEEGYLNEQEVKVARKILLAAALTYVAGAALSMVNIWRWLYLLRGMR